MKERPILFSGPMVRAILEGRKTVTRRVVKPQPIGLGDGWPGHEFAVGGRDYRCPYGQPGDRLWVREAWAADAQVGAIAPRDLSQGEPIMYPADWATRQTGCAMVSQGKIRPSIHMPRWASRILLEITAVRVERLQDISEEQARAEGVEQDSDGWFDYHMPSTQCCASAYESFRTLWSSINGAESWAANHWVWVVEFKRVTA